MSILSRPSLEALGVRYSKNGRIIASKKNWSILSGLPFTRTTGSQFSGMTDGHEDANRTLVEALKDATEIVAGRAPYIVASDGGTANGRPCLSVYDCCDCVNLYL